MSENKTHCADVEALLVRKGFEGLTDQENILLTEHLQSCERCRAYQSVVINAQASLDISREMNLIPAPDIPQVVKGRMRHATPVRDRRRSPAWRYVLRALRHRIPVYQVVLGVVGVMVAWGGVQKWPASVSRPGGISRSEGVQEERLSVTSQEALDRLKAIDRQPVGRTVREDSLLARYVVSAI